ncbi:MAG: hypothetical protein ACSLFF_05875 [Solirubrobacterales bacterium]
MLNSLKARSLIVSLIVIVFAVFAGTAAASVAYIDANEVWVSSDDGARKMRLSAGQGDWREVAQSDQGHILATRKESGKISQLASFTIWDPTGKLIHFGSLSGHIDGDGLNVYPLSLDITPSGGNIVYGYSRSTNYGASLTKGIYLKVSADASTGVPLSLTGGENPTLVGSRIVAAVDSTHVGLQDPSSIGSNVFTPWIEFNTAAAGPLQGLVVTRTDVSATGVITASELRDDTFNTKQIALGKWASLGGAYVDDCILPTAGSPSQISVSQDGSTITWRDSRGVVIAGAPDFSGPASCALTRAPAVLSPSGVYPSYGPFNIAVASKPTLTIGSSIKLKSLKSGAKVTIMSPVGGKAKVTLTIKPRKVGKKGKKLITLASGSANVLAGVPKVIKLKYTSAGKKLKKKLKGKKATLTVKVGDQAVSKTVKLK